ncbi:proton-associated sugar transporter A-like isoform X1 [Planococcus citri]|uniref:proton-associated sugar transporter A-like isoform X1 n=1 Tax=Planococcus citri TaxID=170843 RepID=UPI0031F77D86
MVDKLHNYQGTVGQLHTIRDTVKTNYENWKENRGNLEAKKIIDNVFRKEQVNQKSNQQEEFPFAHLYRKKTRWELIRLCATVMGIEFTYSAITAFSGPILLEIGVKQSVMSLVFTLSPILGFFLSPVTGSLSDRCESRMGRRRIFIVIFSIFEIIGLMLIPHGKRFGDYMGGKSTHLYRNYTMQQQKNSTIAEMILQQDAITRSSSTWVIVFTILGIVVGDYCADALQNPSRAYLLDVCSEEDHTRGLSTFTVLAGCGGTVGYALGSVDWDNSALGRSMGGHVNTVFLLTTIMFTFCVILSITTFREVPLKMIHKVEKQYREHCSKYAFSNINDDLDQEDTAMKGEKGSEQNSPDKDGKEGSLCLNIEPATKEQSSQSKSNCHKGDLLKSNQKDSQVSQEEDDYYDESMPSLDVYLSSIVKLPYSIRILLVTNVLCWMSHVSYSLYFTDYVGEAVFGGDPKAPSNSKEKFAYEEGIRFACLGMTVYSFSCLICSLTMEKIIRRFGLKKVYIANITIDTFSMFLMYYFNCKFAVILFSFASGVLYCTIFTIPYIIVARYHSLNVFEVDENGEHVHCKQVRGLGTDISIIGSSVFIAQFILSCFIGLIVDWYGSTLAVPLTCCVLSAMAVLASTRVVYLDL